ncbi:MAG: enoyl-CoA hydratase/isomerase family protein [Mycolicibacterium sp.]|nr:enoyl-CoA hydratase/isomerase family protein [Mycolicibacterium sp.]
MEFSEIEVIVDGPRADITLNRPDMLNPLGATTLTELVDAACHLDTLPAVKAVVVAGRGRAFSAGADLAAFAPALANGRDDAAPAQSFAAVAREAADAGRRMAEAIEAMRAVTIARIHGHCVGVAVVLAAPCDLRVAADDTRFSIPELDLGIPLAWGGIPRLVREIGPARTKELVMTCRPFGAAEALAAGFLNQVVPASGLDAAVDQLVGLLVSKSTLGLTATKRHTNAVTEGMVGTARAWNDADSLVTALHDPDSLAAARAYLAGLGRG